MEDEFQKFVLDASTESIEKRHLTDLNLNATFNMADFKAVPKE